MSKREPASHSDPRDGANTKRETKYDAEGKMDEYIKFTQKSMEKPYPENGGFYGLGSLREMGLRKSRHSGDWRTKSAFQNKEEEFVQPLRGTDTIMQKGLTIRGAGGERQPSTKTGDGLCGDFKDPGGGRASTLQNVALIRSLGKSLALPQTVQERRTFEEELAELHHPNAPPEWSMRFAYKLFRTYTTPYPSYSYGLNRSASTMGSPAASSRSRTSTSSSIQSAPAISSALALKVEIISGAEMPQMDATGVDESEGCDAYVVLRYDGEERYRTHACLETYTPVWKCQFVLPISRLSQSLPLIVQVWDQDEVHDELIGQTSVNFVSLVRGQREERWHTVTAESFKAFRSVQEKTDTTHAGKVLLALTLDFAHAIQSAGEQREDTALEEETQIVHKWGTETTSVHEDFDLGQLKQSNSSVCKMLETRLSLIRAGINIAVKKNLYGAINSLIKSCSYQESGELYDARLLVEEAGRFADKELAMIHNDSEDRILASKVAMACVALKLSNNHQKASDECKKHLFHVMQMPEVVASLDDELKGSDPDNKFVRSSHCSYCCCTENQPGARVFRHRMLNDVRNLTLTGKEDLQIAGVRGGAPNSSRSGREGTNYPGPGGREVDNCLELLSCADAITLKGHLQCVNAVCVSGDNIFSASADKCVRVWSLTTCQCVRVLDLHHSESINCLAVCPGRFDLQLFSGAENIKSYNIMQVMLEKDTRLPCIHTLEHHKGAITCMATSYYMPKADTDPYPKGWRLVTGSVDRNIHVCETAFIGSRGINPDDPRPIAVLKGHQSTITTVQVAGDFIYSGSLDTTIRIWCSSKFTALSSLSIGGDIINCFCVISARLYVATSDRAILVYDVENLKEVCRLEGHDAYVYCLATHASPLKKEISSLIQDENPMFEMQQRAAEPLRFSYYKPGERCKRFSTVTIGIRKARNLEAKDVRPGHEGVSDPFCKVTIGGDVRISGRVYSVQKVTRSTRVVKETLNPRWNETFTFIVPELLDYKVPAGSSIRAVPIQFDVWDWNTTESEFMGSWKGIIGDLVPDPVLKKSKVLGADGSAPPDDGDLGGWVFLEPIPVVVGKDIPASIGLKVGMSEQGYHWIESKMITDESRGGAGFINKISADGGAVRVVWSHTIGGEKEGVFHPDGWESGITYAVGRDDNHYLQLWDEKPRQHGEIMILCNIFTPQQGEGYPMEPHRTFLYSGSDDETIRVWDLESHTCVSVIKTNHDNKVSDLVCTDSGRLVSASQDCTIKIW